jgi:predicted dehydrogenase
VRAPLTVAVVGAPRPSRLTHTFADLPHASISWFCFEGGSTPRDLFGTAWQAPSPQTTSDFRRLLEDDDLDAIAFDSNAVTRGSLPAQALAAGKHVFMRGPLARTVAEADLLVALAEANHRCLRVYHAPPCTSGARRLRDLVQHGGLGELFYVRATQSGILPADKHLLWDWAADLTALVLELLGDEPIEVSARGESYAQPDVLETIVADLRFATGISAQLHISGIDRRESTRFSLVGSEATALLDGDATRELALHRDTNDAWSGEGRQSASISYPALPTSEPLRVACESFVAATRSQANPGADRAAAAVVSVLEVMEQAAYTGHAAVSMTASDANPAEAPVIHLHVR